MRSSMKWGERDISARQGEVGIPSGCYNLLNLTASTFLLRINGYA